MSTQITTRQPASKRRHQYFSGHRILWMIVAGVGLSLSLSVHPAQAQFCPLGNSWCAALQSLDCQTAAAGETCLPREVGYDPLSGQPIVLLCDCFTDVPGCGPVTITANLPGPGYTASCLGPCPGPQACQVFLNGTAQGVSSIDLSQIPAGSAVSCACAAQGPAFCPLPANAECAARQLADCLSTAGECLPKVIRHHIPPPVLDYFPGAGTDMLEPTTGYVVIQSPVEDELTYYIRESPPNTTQVIRESPTAVGAHREIQMELVAMDLVGVAGGGGGGGAVQIRESPTRASHGRVVGPPTPSGDYPADSFFDLFVEIDIPGMGVHGLYNQQPITLEARGIMAVPPLGSSFKTPQGWPGVYLWNTLGQTGFKIVEVVHELPPPPPPPEWEVIECACIDPLACHVTQEFSVIPTCTGGCLSGEECVQRILSIDPSMVDYSCECVPLEACCLVDGSCQNLLPENCLLIDGTPQGPGTSCLDDYSGNGIDDACETLDHVVCEPQGGLNPTHPNVYWYDVTPQDWGRCDFHVLLVDANAANYSAWTINPWPGNTWQFSVHQVGAETWASWYTPNCAEPMSPGTTYRLQFNHNGASAWSHWRTTYTGNNDPYDPLSFDRSQNHPGEPDGYGYRVHVPQPPTGLTEACCLWDGSCVELPREQCCDMHGTPQGTGTTCATTTCPPPDPIDVGMNIDVHQDNPGVIANDFHIEGMIESGRLPVLVEHIDDLFPNFTYSFVEDPPGNGLWYKFMADWKGFDYPYCSILHLGLKFKVVCHNVMIDLIGWWTKDGVRVGAATTVATGTTSGYWPMLGFDVEDNIRVQPQPEPPDPRGQHIRIQSGNGHAPPEPGEFSVEVVQMDLVAMTQPIPLSELRVGGAQEHLPWVEVLHEPGGPPISLSVPIVIVPDSFFDVFFEMPQPGRPTTATAITIPPGGYLLARQQVRFQGNGTSALAGGSVAAQPPGEELRWFWEMHGAHGIPRPEACCMPDGSCQYLLPSDCVCNDGTPLGPGTACSLIPSACCMPDGTCREVDPLCCVDIGGAPPPNGATTCANADCPSPNDIVWNPALNPGPWPNTNPEATTRSLRFTVAGDPGVKPEAIKVTMIDLQNPNPPNLPANPPQNFSGYESATCAPFKCVGGARNGLTCISVADCPKACVGGTNTGTLCPNGNECTGGGNCPATSCVAAVEANGCARWVGKPGTFLEAQDSGPAAGTYRAARLQCTPFYWDWKPEGLIAVVGSEIAPSSEYAVQVYGASCTGVEGSCTNVSAPVTMYTRRAGDVGPNFNPPATTTQPDAVDVVVLVNKFKGLAGAPVKAIAQIQPNLTELNADLSALDITAAVDGVKGVAYSFSGPCACPSVVPCGITACANATVCINTYGVGSTCVKTCVGGTNDGDPCINTTDPHNHCPGGVCGAGGATPGFCRDRCGRCTP